MKMAAGDPGVGQSTSAHYIYDHGTLWVAASSATTVVPIIPSDDGPGIGGGFASGSGWDDWWDIEDADLGTAPLTPLKSEAVVAVVAEMKAGVAKPATGAVSAEKFAPKIEETLKKPIAKPVVIVSVGLDNVVREMAVVLIRREMPWPFWLAIILILCGIVSLAAFFVGKGSSKRLLWIAGSLVMIGIVTGVVARIVYIGEYAKDDLVTIVDEAVVSRVQSVETVKGIMRDLPPGAHRVTITGDSLSPQVIMTIYVKRGLVI